MSLREDFDRYLENISQGSSFNFDYNNFFAELEKSKAKIKGKPVPTLFHPLVISEKEFSFLKETAENMSKILLKTVELYFKNKEVRDLFNFNETLQEWLDINPGYKTPAPISRYDGLWSSNGYNFCEFNTDGTSGMNEVNTVEEIFLQTETGKELQKKFSLKNLELRKATLECILSNYREFDRKKVPNLAIVDFTESATLAEFEALQETFNSEGIPTEICDIRKLEYRNGSLMHNNFKIDVVYRRAVTDEMLEHKDEIKDFLKAYKDRAVCVVGPLRSQIVHSKLIFIFLSSSLREKYFSSEEVNFINEHIPYTTYLDSDSSFIKEILNNKDSYIVKPHNTYGGKEVYSGSDFELEKWQQLIEKILENKNNSYLAQKKLEIPAKDFLIDAQGNKKTFKFSLGPYIFNRELKGFYTRIAEGDVISISVGGKVLPFFIAG